MNGDRPLQAMVEKYAKIWTEFANLILLFGSDRGADIRISFTRDGSSYSAIGTDCHSIAWDKPTMKLGLTSGSGEDEVKKYVLHEFGHALGCIHEHMSPAAGIKWNKQAVYDHYAHLDPPWSKQEVDDNILKVYTDRQVSYTPFDPTSIMIYPIDKKFTLDGFEVGWNKALSQFDKNFIHQMYP